MNRRKFLKLSAGAAIVPAIPALASLPADGYKDIASLVIPMPARIEKIPGVLVLGPLKYVREWIIWVAPNQVDPDGLYMIRYDIMTKVTQWGIGIRYRELDAKKLAEARDIAEQMLTASLTHDGGAPADLIPIRHHDPYKPPASIAHLL